MSIPVLPSIIQATMMADVGRSNSLLLEQQQQQQLQQQQDPLEDDPSTTLERRYHLPNLLDRFLHRYQIHRPNHVAHALREMEDRQLMQQHIQQQFQQQFQQQAAALNMTISPAAAATTSLRSLGGVATGAAKTTATTATATTAKPFKNLPNSVFLHKKTALTKAIFKVDTPATLYPAFVNPNLLRVAVATDHHAAAVATSTAVAVGTAPKNGGTAVTGAATTTSSTSTVANKKDGEKTDGKKKTRRLVRPTARSSLKPTSSSLLAPPKKKGAVVINSLPQSAEEMDPMTFIRLNMSAVMDTLTPKTRIMYAPLHPSDNGEPIRMPERSTFLEDSSSGRTRSQRRKKSGNNNFLLANIQRLSAFGSSAIGNPATSTTSPRSASARQRQSSIVQQQQLRQSTVKKPPTSHSSSKSSIAAKSSHSSLTKDSSKSLAKLESSVKSLAKLKSSVKSLAKLESSVKSLAKLASSVKSLAKLESSVKSLPKLEPCATTATANVNATATAATTTIAAAAVPTPPVAGKSASQIRREHAEKRRQKERQMRLRRNVLAYLKRTGKNWKEIHISDRALGLKNPRSLRKTRSQPQLTVIPAHDTMIPVATFSRRPSAVNNTNNNAWLSSSTNTTGKRSKPYPLTSSLSSSSPNRKGAKDQVADIGSQQKQTPATLNKQKDPGTAETPFQKALRLILSAPARMETSPDVWTAKHALNLDETPMAHVSEIKKHQQRKAKEDIQKILEKLPPPTKRRLSLLPKNQGFLLPTSERSLVSTSRGSLLDHRGMSSSSLASISSRMHNVGKKRLEAALLWPEETPRPLRILREGGNGSKEYFETAWKQKQPMKLPPAAHRDKSVPPLAQLKVPILAVEVVEKVSVTTTGDARSTVVTGYPSADTISASPMSNHQLFGSREPLQSQHLTLLGSSEINASLGASVRMSVVQPLSQGFDVSQGLSRSRSMTMDQDARTQGLATQTKSVSGSSVRHSGDDEASSSVHHSDDEGSVHRLDGDDDDHYDADADDDDGMSAHYSDEDDTLAGRSHVSVQSQPDSVSIAATSSSSVLRNTLALAKQAELLQAELKYEENANNTMEALIPIPVLFDRLTKGQGPPAPKPKLQLKPLETKEQVQRMRKLLNVRNNQNDLKPIAPPEPSDTTSLLDDPFAEEYDEDWDEESNHSGEQQQQQQQEGENVNRAPAPEAETAGRKKSRNGRQRGVLKYFDDDDDKIDYVPVDPHQALADAWIADLIKQAYPEEEEEEPVRQPEDLLPTLTEGADVDIDHPAEEPRRRMMSKVHKPTQAERRRYRYRIRAMSSKTDTTWHFDEFEDIREKLSEKRQHPVDPPPPTHWRHPSNDGTVPHDKRGDHPRHSTTVVANKKSSGNSHSRVVAGFRSLYKIVSRVRSAEGVRQETSPGEAMIPLQRTRSRTLPESTSFRRDSRMEEPPFSHLLHQAQENLIQSERQRRIDMVRGGAYVQAITKYRPPVL